MKKGLKFICCLNLIIITFLFIDNNLITEKKSAQILDDKKVEKTATKGGAHFTYFIIDQNNKRYKVPQWFFNETSIGDTLIVKRSFFLNKSIQITDKTSEGEIVQKIGVLNSDFFGIGICIISILLCSAILFLPSIFKKEDHLITTFILSTLFGEVIIAFHLIFQA